MTTKKTDAEYKAELTPEQFQVTRQCGTERTYKCVCCGAELFRSDDKFESGSGWPSFVRAMNNDAIRELEDESHGMRRVEVRCKACDAHLGHLFPDGPRDRGGLRYCINSASLDLKKDA